MRHFIQRSVTGLTDRAKRIEQGARSIAWKVAELARFRFQDLEIWQMAIEIADEIFDIADNLEQRRPHRFAEQL